MRSSNDAHCSLLLVAHTRFFFLPCHVWQAERMLLECQNEDSMAKLSQAVERLKSMEAQEAQAAAQQGQTVEDLSIKTQENEILQTR